MSEAERLTGSDPRAILKRLRGHGSHRKFRLFAAACAQLLPLAENADRAAVEVALRYADGAASPAELKAVSAVALRAVRETPTWPLYPRKRLKESIWAATQSSAFGSAWTTAGAVPEALGVAARERGRLAAGGDGDWPAYREAIKWAEAQAVALLRDLFGPPTPLDPCLRWGEGGVAVRLAQAIYDDRAFDRLPVLADALEDVGCTDADILGHLRGAGPHVRGCWAVDLLLGKE
jgi:hypothetical protein